MNALRLVMVTPRYWPLVGETERFVAQLAQELRSTAVQTTILTAAWAGEWPREVVHNETRTVRLPSAPRGGWNTFRYMRSVARWLREHHREMDLAYVMNLTQDAHASIGALCDKPVGIVLCATAGDCGWLETTRLGGRIKRRTFQADAIVAPTNSFRAELVDAGYARARVHTIGNGAEAADSPSAAGRYQARTALAAVNHDLSVAEYAPVAVSVGRLEQGSYLFDLVDSWRTISARWPSSRLWLLGDGPLREALYERIVDQELHHQIFLPGTFDELVDVFQAADVFIEAAPAGNGGQFVLEAMAAGLPAIAADTPDHRDLVEHGLHGLLVPPRDSAAMAEAIATLFDAAHVAKQYGEAARQRVKRELSRSRVAEKHVQLFEQVLASKHRGRG